LRAGEALALASVAVYAVFQQYQVCRAAAVEQAVGM
jgi:hypothetical protein